MIMYANELYQIRHRVSKSVWDRSAKIMGRVVYYRFGKFRLSGMVQNTEGDFFYSPTVAKDGTFYCDCIGFEGAETICSHILAMLRKAEFDGENVTPYINAILGIHKEEQEMVEYKTSIEGYNRLFGGLQSGRHISCLFALPETCKSYINAQFAVDMAVMHNKSSLIIDTEGGFAPEWITLISERMGKEVPYQFIDWRVKTSKTQAKDAETYSPDFKYSDLKIKENKDPTVYIYDARHLVQIYPFFGRPMNFKIKGGVIEPMEGGNSTSISDSPIGKIIDACNIVYVANDSLSMPIESFFTGGQINYRTRTKATQVWLGRAQELIDEFGVCFMNTAHATIAHNNPYAVPQPVGGKAVLHNNKYIAYIEKWAGKKAAKKSKVDWHNLRKMSIYRHMTKAAWSEFYYMITTGAGVVDFDPAGEVEEEKGDDE